MTRNIVVGLNEDNGKKYYFDCEIFSSPLVVGGTYKGEVIEEVEGFSQPKAEGEETSNNCQIVTTSHYHEVVIIE